jgi:uncharacterized membrane protein
MSDIPSYTPPPPPPPGGSYTPPPPPPPGGTAPSSDRTIMLVLSYLGLLSLIPFFAKKDDPEVQWHAKNGVALLGAEIVWMILAFILAFVHIPFLGCGISAISCVVWLGFLALSIICIMKAVKGERFRIPIITDIAEKL